VMTGNIARNCVCQVGTGDVAGWFVSAIILAISKKVHGKPPLNEAA